jgi:hypothetical protein
VTIAVPVYTAPTAPQAATYSYNISTASWIAETLPSAVPSGVIDDAGADQTPPIQYVTIQVPHLTWWGVTNGPAPSTASGCVTGTVQVQAGGPLANAFVRSAGVNFLGTSTAQTSSSGVFCLDLAASTEDAGAGIQLFAEALSAGSAYSATPGFQVALGIGSCESGDAGSACMPLGAITLTPTLTCVSGTLSPTDGVTLPPTLDVTLEVAVTESAQNAGIEDLAYIGQTALDAEGGFCALAPPGGEVELVQPGTGCSAPPPGDEAILVQGGTGALSCAGGGCVDAGAQTFGCGLPQ